ncbi:putative trans-sialidase, Group II [Trypanosoma cruzi]|uniref:Putative trans-sialidase, Group II n=2 Tax=Trypanosoma cruzi TaxID=5693 RepID=A0A2V2WDY0_TRYCR|nr:putative trans-sialidase, Group II [Trypanosoma cruzi]
MLSRVAAVMAPRTHNRRRVTGSSGRRREGRDREPQRPNMSRRVFTSAVLLLLVVMMCCSGGASNAVTSNSGNAQLPQGVDLFVPQMTLVVPKGGTSQETIRNSFISPSLVSAGGVIAAFAEGQVYTVNGARQNEKTSSDVVAEYIDSSWDWSALVGKVNESTWKANTVLGTTNGTDNRADFFYHPTTTTKGNKVFLLAGSLYKYRQTVGKQTYSGFKSRIELVVGDVREPTSSEPTERIKWGEIRSLLNESTITAHKGKLTWFLAAGGSGVLMEDGTLVFPLMAESGNGGYYSMIIYSKDNGSTWALSTGVSPANCTDPRITEWDGSLLMIVNCNYSRRVYESRDMGKKWTEAIGTLPGVWVNSRLYFWDLSLRVEALITATIEERKVMLYTQRGYALGENANTLYLWVTDNNRSFYVGPVATDAAGNWEFASSLMYSDGNLHLLQQRGSSEHSVISLSRLTEELSAIESVLSTWAQKDIFFSSLSIPTAGLVAALSDAASDDTWNDEYLCVNATVTNAKKVKNGFQLTGHSSGVLWSVNTRGDGIRHVSLSHSFTLVASVTIEEAPSEKTPLLDAMLGDTNSNHTMGLSYTADNKWETMFGGKVTTESRSWEPKKEHQVALMLQSQKVSVYIDGQSLGEEELPLKGESTLELVRFCFGACGEDAGQKTKVTVTNVFLYNRPLNSTEMRAIKDRIPVPTRGPETQVEGMATTEHLAAVHDPREVPAALGRTTVERSTATEHAAAVSFTSAGSGLLPLLFLLGLWGFAAA